MIVMDDEKEAPTPKGEGLVKLVPMPLDISETANEGIRREYRLRLTVDDVERLRRALRRYAGGKLSAKEKTALEALYYRLVDLRPSRRGGEQ